MLAAYVCAYLLEYARLLKSLQLALLTAVLISSLLVGTHFLLEGKVISSVSGLVQLDPGAVLVVFFVIWLWWRGISLAREPIRPLVAWRRFELGLLMFLLHVFILTRIGEHPPGLGLFVFFLFTGLMAVVLARISFVSVAHGVEKNPFDRRWLASTAIILGTAVGISALLGSLLTGQYALLLEWLAESIKLVVAVVIFIAALPGLFLSNFLGPLVSFLRRFATTPTPDPNSLLQTPEPLSPLVGAGEPQPLSPAFQSLIFWGLIFLILVLLINRVRQKSGGARMWSQDSPESLLERGDARRLLRKAFQDAANELASRLRPARRLLVAARVRRIYAQLMGLCAELDFPRPAAQTPLEFLPSLGELFPDRARDLDMITQAYVNVRYGELPETQEEVEALENAWKNILAEGQRLKKAGMHKLKTAEYKEVRRSGM
jgi:hypothetical protein